MSALAALPMYDWPEARAQTDRLYAALRVRVPELPPELTRPADATALHALWRDPALVLAQTCWGPMGQGLAAHVMVLAQPDYGDVSGGRGVFYRSALVARDGKICPVPTSPDAALPEGLAQMRLAINGADSLSGALAPVADAEISLEGAQVTGSHRASVRAVAEGRADMAAIDCRSWAMARAHEPAAGALRVIGWTAERAGLPFITSRHTPAALRARLTDALVALGAHAPTRAA